MVDQHAATARKRRSTHAPFPRIICVLDDGPGMDAAVTQAIAVADGDSRIRFATSSYGTGSADAHASDERARDSPSARSRVPGRPESRRRPSSSTRVGSATRCVRRRHTTTSS
jgi:hypothetical protein